MKSEYKKSFWGKEYIQHTDSNGKKIGTLEHKKSFWGNEYIEHNDSSGKKTGTSEHKKDSLSGESYTQHYDANGNPTSYTERKKNIWGNIVETTKSGEKKNSGYYVAILLVVLFVIWLILKVVIPLLYLTLPIILLGISIFRYSRKENNNLEIATIVISIFQIIDYLFGGYAKYLVEDNSFVTPYIYYSVAVSLVIVVTSLFLVFSDKLDSYLTSKK
jgi:hypothetical protein